jgi:hypothetical protein
LLSTDLYENRQWTAIATGGMTISVQWPVEPAQLVFCILELDISGYAAEL